MRFPLSLTRTMTAYLLNKRIAGEKRYPLVLMLEPLFACNLKCSGCGRIREYADAMRQTLSVEECLASIDECGAPVVSICGGEPLIYPAIDELVAKTLERRKHIYLCTNGVRLAQEIGRFRPSSRLAINVHIDGMEATHDAIVERPGVFAKAIEGIEAAKRAGFLVYSNTTIYRQTNMDEVAVLFDYLSTLGVDGLMISPSYPYEAVSRQSPGKAAGLFMTRDEVHAKFAAARKALSRYPLATSPLYLDFLCGRRELNCAAWANPTRNVRGWKGPCYLVTDRHYKSYRELVDSTDWDRLGSGGDPRCQHCLVHCGYEPAAVLATDKSLRDVLKMVLWQMA